jgi:hypothetical protein
MSLTEEFRLLECDTMQVRGAEISGAKLPHRFKFVG